MAELEPKWKLVLPEPLLGLTESCCVICVPKCCGVDAYDICADCMTPWIVKHGLPNADKALRQLDDLIAWAGEQAHQVWSDGCDFNAIWEPMPCVNYFQQWRSELIRAMTLVSRDLSPPP